MNWRAASASPKDGLHARDQLPGVEGLGYIVVCSDLEAESSFSTSLELSTPIWGDTVKDFTTVPPGPPEGDVTILDALAVIGAFISADGAIVKVRADLEPGCLDLLINITDVLSAITGFQGLDYPFEP